MKCFIAIIMLLLGFVRIEAQSLQLCEDNIDEIVRSMTLEEKALLLVGGQNEHFGGGNNSTVGATQILVLGAAGTTVAIPRLGIPVTVLADGPAGLRISPTRLDDTNTYYATGFPVGTSLACSWNVNLVEKVGGSIGQEVLEYGVDVLLAPGMNIHRSPLCGRNFEYYSEDPVVTGKMAAAYVRGVQSNGVGTSIKHYAANSQETNRTGVDEIISQRALREIYLKGFEIAVKEGMPWTVMTSYNKLNGLFTQDNKELLATVLRGEWGFKGMVMTDWIGQRNTATQIRAGNDLMEPGTPLQSREIIAKVKSGELSIEDIDASAKRILSYVVKTPKFKGYRYNNKPDLKSHATIARQSATEGMVLLKNDNGTLPFRNIKNVALFGITSYDFIAGGTGSGDVNKPYVVNMLQGLNNAGLEIAESLKKQYLAYEVYQNLKIESDKIPGGWYKKKNVLPEMSVSRACINRQAQEAELAILTIGRQTGEGSDRDIFNNFNLTNLERQLLNDLCDAFHGKGKKVVVVLNVAGVIETASWKDLPDAILLAWQPGQEGGNAVADVLTGKENPSGKLSMTFPIAAMDHPSSLNFPIAVPNLTGPYAPRVKPNVDYTLHKEGINIGYRYFHTKNKPVSYPFGYGLSYTVFSYSKPSVKAASNGFQASIQVTNIGQVAGKEVVQLYISAPKGKVAKPASELKAFAKTKLLQPGESETLSLEVSDYELGSFDENIQSWVSDKGNYLIKFASSVEDVRATGYYKLSKDYIRKVNDVLKPNMNLD